MKLKLIFIVSTLLLGTIACLAVKPAQENKSPQPKTIQHQEFAVITRSVADGVHSKISEPSHQKVIESNEDIVQIKLNLWEMAALDNLNVRLTLNQKLVILPDLSFDRERWFVYTDNPEMLTLASTIDPANPPLTGWVWTPNFTGSTTILIREPKFLCDDSKSGCVARPTLQVNIPVKILSINNFNK